MIITKSRLELCGFTLLELLTVVAIVGILVAIGIPSYKGYIATTRANNAQNNLRSIYLQEQEYYTDNNIYYKTGVACGDFASSINTTLFNGNTYIDDDHYNYCITQNSVSDFTAHAINKSDSTIEYTIDNDGTVNF